MSKSLSDELLLELTRGFAFDESIQEQLNYEQLIALADTFIGWSLDESIDPPPQLGDQASISYRQRLAKQLRRQSPQTRSGICCRFSSHAFLSLFILNFIDNTFDCY